MLLSLTSYVYDRHLSSSLTLNWTQKQYVQVTLILSVFNTPLMIFQDHSKSLMSHCE